MLRILRDELRATFSAQSSGVPEWELELAQGDDGGYFAPGSAVWSVHSGMTPIAGGIRALLIQTLHPGVMAGVHDHSHFHEDPLGRLARTIQWIFTVTYGDTKAARQSSAFVLRLHENVTGTYLDARGAERRYAANDPALLSWVHLAFTDSILSAHKVWGGPIPGGPDQYVREWAKAGELMGVPNPPRSEKELAQQLAAHYDDGVLASSPSVREAVRFLHRPPLHPILKPGYRLLFAGVVTTIEPRFRRILGIQPARLGPLPLPVRRAAGLVLRITGRALGQDGPSKLAALSRRRRLGL